MSDKGQTEWSNAELALRVTVWNFLRGRGVKQDDCLPIVEKAVADFHNAAALAARQGYMTIDEARADLRLSTGGSNV